MNEKVKNIVIAFAIGCMVFIAGNWLSDGFQFDSFRAFLINFSFYQLYSFVIGYANMYFFRFMNSRNWKPNSFIKRIIFGVLGSTIITLILLFFLRTFTAVAYSGLTLEEFLEKESVKNYQFGLWITLAIMGVFHLIYFYNRYQQNRIKEQKVIAGTASAQFDALKNQLDPHFLFNSLNVLTSLIEEDPRRAQKFTTSLSKVYRYVLEQKNKELVSVDEELKFAKTYMSLLEMRFEDSIIYSIPENAANPESKVVPLSLQLLLENAVKHNTVTVNNPLRITIYEEAGNLIVENNLQPKEIIKRSSGVGLSNIMQRYDLLTEKKVQIFKENNRFAVSLPILTKQITMMNTNQSEMDDAYVRARNHVEELKGFYYSLISFCLVIPFLIFINYQTYWGFQWFWFPVIGWGIGLTVKAFRVFINDGAFGRNWEKRKIEQFIREEEKQKWN